MSKEKQKQVTQQEMHNRKHTMLMFENAQQFSRKYSPVKLICNIISKIIKHLNDQRPEPGRKKRHDDPKNQQDWRQDPKIYTMLQQIQKLMPKNGLGEKDWDDINKFGMSLPGAILSVVQQFVFGNTKGAINFDSYNSGQELISGSKLGGSLVAEKSHERSLQEGGLSPEEIDSDMQELGIKGASKPCQIDPAAS